MKKLTAILVLLLAFGYFAQAQTEEPAVPKNAKMISQVIISLDLIITVVDLDNNELVVVRYSKTALKMISEYELVQVLRTGMKVNPEDYDCVRVERYGRSED